MRSRKVWGSWVSDGYLRHWVQGQLLQDQHRCAGDDVLRCSLEGAFGAIVRDMGRESKIGARCPMRNERSYNSSLGPTRVGAIQTPVSVPPETRPCQPPRPQILLTPAPLNSGQRTSVLWSLSGENGQSARVPM